MDNNIHNDGLEDFLRKSFEAYDDSPSDGLWDKIETDLAQQPKVVPLSQGRRWWMGAAAAVLLALVIGQYIYFQKEKSELVEIINTQANKIEQLEKQLKEQGDKNSGISNAENNKQENIFNENNAPIAAEIKKQPKNTAINNASAKKGKTYHAKNEDYKQTAFVENADNNFESNLNTNTNTNTSTNSNSNIDKIEKLNLIENKRDIETISGQRKTIAPNTLQLIGLKNIEQPTPSLSLPTLAIDPVSDRGSFSLGVHHTYLSTEEKMARVIQRPTAGRARIFNNTKAMTGTTQITGIGAIYKTPKNWLFESGLSYRKTNLSTSHRAQLRFMDRRQNNSDQQHDFVYALNTSVGVVDIEVRADQTNPDQTINEFDKVIVEIETKQSVNYVSVPLLFGRQIGHGRLNATLKAGVLLNFLTDQSFDISANIISGSLRHNKTSYSRRIGLGLKNMTTDFVAALGLNYELNKKWDAHISPTLLVPMGNRHTDPYIKSSGFSAGVNFGLNFKF